MGLNGKVARGLRSAKNNDDSEFKDLTATKVYRISIRLILYIPLATSRKQGGS